MENKSFLDQLDSVTLVDDPRVKDPFVETYSKIHKVSLPEAEAFYKKESTYYKQLVYGNEKLKSCTKISLYSAWLEIAITGMSIQPGGKSLAYLEARSSKTRDNKGKEMWVSSARLILTTYGELELRIQSGQILAMMNPIIVYDGDHFQPRTNAQGEVYVDYSAKVPRQKDAKIIGSWVRIVVPGNINDFKWLLEEDIERLKKCSIPKSGQNPQPNALYSSNNGGIDPGFLEAKTIKHAMRSKGKLKVGTSVAVEDEEEEEVAPFTEPAEEKETILVVTKPNEPF